LRLLRQSLLMSGNDAANRPGRDDQGHRQFSVSSLWARRRQKLLIRNGFETSARLEPEIAQDTLTIRAKDVGCVHNRARDGELGGDRTHRDR
jgi:hypothetical protein